MRSAIAALGFLGVLAGSARVANAGDSTKLVCSALVRPTDGFSQLGLFVHFLDSRASDGESRNETLSTIYQGTLFQAKTLNKTGAPPQNVTIAMTAGKRAVYRGTYSVTRDRKTGTWAIRLMGTFDEDPSAKQPIQRPIEVDLPCVDISN